MKDCKSIVFVNYNGGSPIHGPNLRSFYHAKSLANKYDVRIISSSYSHKYHTPPLFDGVMSSEIIEGVRFFWLKVPKYRTIIQRIICQYIFGIRFILNMNKIVPRNSILVFSCPPQDLIFFVYLVSKIRNCTLISDVRDIWPLTQIQMSKINLLNPYTYILYLAQYIIYRSSKKVISPLERLCDQFPSILKSKFSFVPNTSFASTDECMVADLEILHAPEELGGLSLDIGVFLERTSRLKIVYSGSFDRDNAFEYLLYVAEKLPDADIIFIFVGDGVRRHWLLDRAKKCSNVIVLDKLSPKHVVPFLRNVDVGFCSLKSKPIYRFGVSLGKSFEYLRAGLPIIWMVDAPPVLEHACLKVRAEDLEDLTCRILNLLNERTFGIDLCRQDIKQAFEDTYSISAIGSRLTLIMRTLK